MANNVDFESVVADLESKCQRLQRAIDTLIGDTSTINYDPTDQSVTLKTSHRGVTRAIAVSHTFPCRLATKATPIATLHLHHRHSG